MDIQDRLTERTAVRGEGIGGWVRKVKGLSKETKRKTHGHRQQYGDCQRKVGGREGIGGIKGDGKRLDLG